MKTSLKLASLAALTAATLALPAAAQDIKDSVKCMPNAGVAKCGAKKDSEGSKCGAKCAPKCGTKCGPKN